MTSLSIIVFHPKRGTAILHNTLEAWQTMREWSTKTEPAKAYLCKRDSFTYEPSRFTSFQDYINGR